MINFVESNKSKQGQINKIRRWVVGITSLVLGIYTIVVMGLLGFMWFLKDRDTKVNQEAVILDRKLASFAALEVLARKADDRANDVVTYFDTRESVFAIGKVLEQGALLPQMWNFDLGRKKQTVTVVAATTESVKGYVNYLAEKFKTVKIDGLTWDSEVNMWLANISFWGIIKENS